MGVTQKQCRVNGAVPMRGWRRRKRLPVGLVGLSIGRLMGAFVAGLVTIGQAWAQQAGSIRWSIPIASANQSPAGTVSSPALARDGTIYVGSAFESTDVSAYARRLLAISPQGTTNWIFCTGGPVTSSPAIAADGTVYVGSQDGNLYAINPKGTTNWVFRVGGAIPSSPAVGADGTIYANGISNYFNKLFAVWPNGGLRWVFAMGAVSFSAQASAQFSSPSIGPGGGIYIGSQDKHIYAINPDGTTNWVFPLTTVTYASPAIGPDGTVYVGADDHNVYAIDTHGKLKWKFGTGSYVECSAAVSADGRIYIGSLDGDFYALNTNGVKQWAAATGMVSSSPAIGADGTVYVGSLDTFYALAPSGTNRWTLSAGGSGSVFASPAIAGDGTVYVTMGGRLYAINGTSGPMDSAWPMFRHDERHTARSVQCGLSAPTVLSEHSVGLTLTMEMGRTYRVQASVDLLNWTEVANFLSTNCSDQFSDCDATNCESRFYRLVTTGK